MLKFTAFKTKKPRQFEYRPRYYDPEKEARKERKIELLGPDEEDEKGEYKPGQYIKGQMMRNKMTVTKKQKEDKIAKLIRLTVVAAMMLLIVFFFLKYL